MHFDARCDVGADPTVCAIGRILNVIGYIATLGCDNVTSSSSKCDNVAPGVKMCAIFLRSDDIVTLLQLLRKNTMGNIGAIIVPLSMRRKFSQIPKIGA